MEEKLWQNLDSVLKNRVITLLTKVCIVKAMAFPVVMYGCESWTIKKAEHQRTDAILLWYWRRPLKVCKEIKPVNLKRYQSSIFIGRTTAKAEVPMLRPPDAKSWCTAKDPDAGKKWRQTEKGKQRVRWLVIITDSIDMNLSKLREIAEDRGIWYATVHGVAELDTA